VNVLLPGVPAAIFAGAPRLARALRCAVGALAGERVTVEGLWGNESGVRVVLPAADAGSGECGGGARARRELPAAAGRALPAAATASRVLLNIVVAPAAASEGALAEAGARVEAARAAVVAGTAAAPCAAGGAPGGSCGLSSPLLCPALTEVATAAGVAGGACALSGALSVVVGPAAVPVPLTPPPSAAADAFSPGASAGVALGVLAAAGVVGALYRRAARRAAPQKRGALAVRTAWLGTLETETTRRPPSAAPWSPPVATANPLRSAARARGAMAADAPITPALLLAKGGFGASSPLLLQARAVLGRGRAGPSGSEPTPAAARSALRG
jgi:hypothetical protein